MTCPKCRGLVVATFDEEDPSRCLSCGWRPNAPYDEPIREPYSRTKCCNCQNKAVAGKHYCQPCLDYMIDYHKKKKALA